MSGRDLDTNQAGPLMALDTHQILAELRSSGDALYMASVQGPSAAHSAAKTTGTAASDRTAVTLTPHSLDSGAGPARQQPFNAAPSTMLFAAEVTDVAGAATALSGDGAADGDGESGDQARRDGEDAKAALGQVREDLLRLREELIDQREQLDRALAQVDTQLAGVDKVLQAGSAQAPGRAFQLMAGQAALADDIEDAQEAAHGEGQTFWDRIKHWLGRAGKKLWAMISRLVSVKEWSLTGKVGTGVLGLAEASISVTFGHLDRG